MRPYVALFAAQQWKVFEDNGLDVEIIQMRPQVANAAMIKKQLGEPIEGEYPPEFVERFPNLADVVTVGPPSATASRTFL